MLKHWILIKLDSLKDTLIRNAMDLIWIVVSDEFGLYKKDKHIWNQGLNKRLLNSTMKIQLDFWVL